ncbi:hypothetical protein PAT3040_03077 [Paenibacillus agaridevorans]|uniref:SLH domain-containing protein n=1 Tax=Paenibacillus agaridevorans TaxID=171404 RepID=A0A2R5EP92_9BACL|nr:S-layer homology domain-containing protein [Paenibacillus agaridevorans]GBG08492.1 hypothetical protein PAT3040_03077 [Paenibacillus agaridevorans]
MKKWSTIFLAAILVLTILNPTGANAELGGTGFKDVSETYWAADEINNLVSIGVLRGFEDNTFKPEAPVTREQFAQIITLAFQLDLPTDQTQSFTDVSTTRWSHKPVEAAKPFLTGYTSPNGKAFFLPAAKATREDVAVALVKTMNYLPDDLENPNILNRFYDGDLISPNLRTYLALAVEKKLLTGYTDNTIRPEDPVTRAQAAALVYRVIKGAAADNQTALQLNVDAPETVSSPTVYISGDVNKGAQVFINNKEAEVVQGQFRVGIQLEAEGVYTYTISARIPGGKTETVTKQVKYEKGAPTLEVKGVPESTDKQTITVSWTVKDANDHSPAVYINGEKQSSYSSSATIKLEEGENTLTFRAENSAGKYTLVTKRVAFLTGGPELIVPDLPASTDQENVTVTWTVKDKNDNSPQVYVNEIQQSSYSNSTKVQLKEGQNTITVRATNNLGKTTLVTKTITFNVGSATLSVGALPETTDKETVTVNWTVKDPNDSSPQIFVNDTAQGSYYSYTTINLQPGDNTITVRAVNKLGKSSEVTKVITFNPPAPTLTLLRAPEASSSSSVTISWSTADKNDYSPIVYIGEERQYSSSKSLSLKEGPNTFIISSTNKYGKTVTVTYNVTYTPVS